MYISILLSALALVLIFESLLPFLSPTLWRRLLFMVASRSVKSTRLMGLIGLLLGSIIMIIVHTVGFN